MLVEMLPDPARIKVPPEIELPGEEKHNEQMTQAWEGKGEWERETARLRKRK